MNITIRHVSIVSAMALTILFPQKAFATADRNITGVVTKLVGNQIIFKTTNAVVYSAETSNTVLVRKNGAPLQFSEFAIGDKVEVHGQVWKDNSMTTTRIRDLTMYTHNGTFTGKITAFDVSANILTLLGTQYGSQTIHMNPQTVYMKNGSIVPLEQIAVGMSATIKGTWERARTEVVAREVRATARLLNIDITGELVLKDGLALTVTSNGVLYGIDASTAKVRSKNNKVMNLSELSMSTVRVQGKHIPESTHIVASSVKDLTKSK